MVSNLVKSVIFWCCYVGAILVAYEIFYSVEACCPIGGTPAPRTIGEAQFSAIVFVLFILPVAFLFYQRISSAGDR